MPESSVLPTGGLSASVRVAKISGAYFERLRSGRFFSPRTISSVSGRHLTPNVTEAIASLGMLTLQACCSIGIVNPSYNPSLGKDAATRAHSVRCLRTSSVSGVA